MSHLLDAQPTNIKERGEHLHTGLRGNAGFSPNAGLSPQTGIRLILAYRLALDQHALAFAAFWRTARAGSSPRSGFRRIRRALGHRECRKTKPNPRPSLYTHLYSLTTPAYHRTQAYRRVLAFAALWRTRSLCTYHQTLACRRTSATSSWLITKRWLVAAHITKRWLVAATSYEQSLLVYHVFTLTSTLSKHPGAQHR